MNNYEKLLDKAHKNGLIVKEKPLQSSDGRICGNKIAIRVNLESNRNKACVLAEELGHHITSVGDIVNIDYVNDLKQERKARLWAYNEMVGLRGFIDAYEHGCQNRYDIAEYLEITEEFLQECVDCYRNKYGVGKMVDNYYIMFIPHLAVGRIIN